MAFSLAEKYYAMVLAIDNMKHEAYWGLLQAKLNCCIPVSAVNTFIEQAKAKEEVEVALKIDAI